MFMFSIVASWFAGFVAGIWVLLIKMEGSNAIESGCEMKTITSRNENIQVASCELTGSSKIPTDLDENIQGLILNSRSPNTPINADGPIKFTNLIQLRLILIRLKAPKDFFSLLTSLRGLKIIVNFENNEVPDLPHSIEFLFIASTTPKNLDLSGLYKLSTLNYTSNNLTEFPSLPSTAPLTHLNLAYNKLTNLKLPDIAQYCSLKYVDLTSTSIQSGSKAAYCELKAWFDSHNIAFKMEFEYTRDCHSKEVTENAEAVKKYEDCLGRSNLWKNLHFSVLAAIGIVLGILIITVAVTCLPVLIPLQFR